MSTINVPDDARTIQGAVKRQNSSEREAANKKLALMCGWKRTENRNWEAPTGEIYALPPDYCRNKSKLASLVETSLTRKELESVATYILSLKVESSLDCHLIVPIS